MSLTTKLGFPFILFMSSLFSNNNNQDCFKKGTLNEIFNDYKKTQKDTLYSENFADLEIGLFGILNSDKSKTYFYDSDKNGKWDVAENYKLPIRPGKRPVFYFIKDKDKRIIIKDIFQDGLNGNEKIFSCNKEFNPYLRII